MRVLPATKGRPSASTLLVKELSAAKKRKESIEARLKKIAKELKAPATTESQQKKLLKEREALTGELSTAQGRITSAHEGIRGLRESAGETAGESAGEEETPAQQAARETTEANTAALEAEQKAVEEAKAVEEERIATPKGAYRRSGKPPENDEGTGRNREDGPERVCPDRHGSLAEVLSGHFGAKTNLLAQTVSKGSLGSF